MIEQAAPPPAVVAPAPAPRFVPPLGVPLRLLTVQKRQIGTQHLRFTAERRLVFRAEPGGFSAELTLQQIDVDAPAATATRFRKSQAALVGRLLRFHLDRAGRVLSLDDAEGHWEAQAAGLDGAGGNPLRGIAVNRRLPLLASLLTQVIATEAPPEVGTHPVTVPLPGAAKPANGIETVSRPDTDSWSTSTRASAVTDAGTASLSRQRTFSIASGLLRSSEEITRLTAVTANDDPLETITTTVTSLMVP